MERLEKVERGDIGCGECVCVYRFQVLCGTHTVKQFDHMVIFENSIVCVKKVRFNTHDASTTLKPDTVLYYGQ